MVTSEYVGLARDVVRWFSDPGLAALPAITQIRLRPAMWIDPGVSAQLSHGGGVGLVVVAPWAEQCGSARVTRTSNAFRVSVVSEPGESGAHLEVWTHLQPPEVCALGRRAVGLLPGEFVEFTAEEIRAAAETVRTWDECEEVTGGE
jgi:hypothetical protein